MLTSPPTYHLTSYYTETMIQFSFVTMYAAVFPLGAVCAIIRNIAEMLYLAYKYGTKWRWPIAERAQDIGIYLDIVKFISYFAIIINAIMIATNTQLIPKLVHSQIAGEDNFVSFRLKSKNISDQNKTCWQDYRMPLEDNDLTTLPKEALWDRFIGTLVASLFTIFMIVFASLINLVPNIPDAENLTLLKESYLAQKILQQYLTVGSVRQVSWGRESMGQTGGDQGAQIIVDKDRVMESRHLAVEHLKGETTSAGSSSHKSLKSAKSTA